MSRDWETVKMLCHETVHRNRIKLVATEKALNSQRCLITLYIEGWVIIPNGVILYTEKSQTFKMIKTLFIVCNPK